MRKICPFIVPWPLAMIDPKWLRKPFTISPESMPWGAFTAVTEELGLCGANSSSPSAVTALRVPRARSCAFSISLSMPSDLMYFRDSASARIRLTLGVHADSPLSAIFFSRFRSKYSRGSFAPAFCAHAFSLTDTKASPGGIMNAFCDPPTTMSSPQPSMSSFIVPRPVMASTMHNAPVFFVISAIAWTSCAAPVEVSEA